MGLGFPFADDRHGTVSDREAIFYGAMEPCQEIFPVGLGPRLAFLVIWQPLLQTRKTDPVYEKQRIFRKSAFRQLHHVLDFYRPVRPEPRIALLLKRKHEFNPVSAELPSEVCKKISRHRPALE